MIEFMHEKRTSDMPVEQIILFSQQNIITFCGGSVMLPDAEW